MRTLNPSGDGREPDLRQRRTRANLRKAVLEVAAERDISGASVADVARRASVDRSTFYAHARSPLDLLTQVLAEELDAMRTQAFSAIDAGQSLRRIADDVHRTMIDHVLRHEAIYAAVDRLSSKTALWVVLGEHLRQSILQVLQNRPLPLPVERPQAIPLFAASISHALVGTIEAWLVAPGPRNRGLLEQVLNAIYPDWYLAPIAAGRPQDASA